MGNLSHGHQVRDMEHDSLMQGHYAGALVEVSFMGIQWGVPRQGCCAGGFTDVTWRVLLMSQWDVVHLSTTRPWTWLDLWADYGAFLLHGEPRHLAENFGPRHVCLLGCWLEMTHGAHDDMRLWLLRTSYYGLGGSEALRSWGQGLWCSMGCMLLCTFMGVL